jgi:hypothetical protein
VAKHFAYREAGILVSILSQLSGGTKQFGGSQSVTLCLCDTRLKIA